MLLADLTSPLTRTRAVSAYPLSREERRPLLATGGESSSRLVARFMRGTSEKRVPPLPDPRRSLNQRDFWFAPPLLTART
jgi:hypothetical protein